jgi:hypothetical protein
MDRLNGLKSDSACSHRLKIFSGLPILTDQSSAIGASDYLLPIRHGKHNNLRERLFR